MTSSIGLNLRVTGHCNQGGRKYMEDAFVVAYQQSEDQKDLEYAYFGIFDGHGGREAALFAKEHLMNNIVCQKSFWSEDDDQILKAIRDGFLATHHAMWREVGKWPKTVSGLPSTSGTTSSIAFIRRRKLYIGHVGDSKIVLGYQIPGSTEWSSCALTKDHKPESPEEKQRINSVGGLVLNKSGVDRVVWNRPRPGHKGPVRRSTPFDQIPFLAVARSLGDLWSYNYLRDEFVVSPDPDVKVFNINPQVHRCVIFASDGLWNMMSPYTAVKIVQKAEEDNEKLILENGKTYGTGKQPNNPSKLLVDSALLEWFDLGMRADNTSVVTVMLDPPGPPKSEVLLRQRVMKRLRPRDEQSDENADGKNASAMNAATSPKEKRKNLDSCDAQSSREGKRSSESIPETACKERKLSNEADDSVPKNLPKPVILSPQRVAKPLSNKPKPYSSDATKSSAATPPSPVKVKIKKKNDEPDKLPNTPLQEDEVKPRSSLTNSLKTTKDSAQESVTELPSEKMAVENSQKNATSSTVQKTEPCIAKSSKKEEDATRNSNSKENGRVHLCEVDNIFKLTDRTSDGFDASESSKSSSTSKDKVILPKVKKFQKRTLKRRTSVIPRVRKQRPLRNFTKHKATSGRCYTITRAQRNRIRKLKV